MILAPTRRDARLTATVLADNGIEARVCADAAEVARELTSGAGAVLLAEEVVAAGQCGPLVETIAAQPAWSDVPVMLITAQGADSPAVTWAIQSLGNVMLVERPTRVITLVSAVRSALRARHRQYQTRDDFENRARNLRAQAFLGAIVASSDDAIVSMSLDGVIQTWNAGAERLFGYAASETVGKSITMLIPPDRIEEENGLLEQLRRGESVQHLETVRITKEGRRIDVSLTSSPVRDADGRLIGASKIARDITERKRSEAALRDAARRKDEFLATLAHELRNPLAPIRNSLHILRMQAGAEATDDRVLEMMERQVDHMVRLVDDLMEVSRITRGSIELRRQAVDLATVIRGAVETSRPLIEAAGHQLAISLPAEPIPLFGDEMRLGQVFANLLNNAAKYTDRGGQIWITAQQQGSEVAVVVRDNGIGLAPEALDTVFEMFMQADRTHERSQGGLGIGLTLVKSLVEMHGGSVAAHSEGRHRGSEFTVRLPVATVAARTTRSPTTPQPVASATRRVLVVDDNSDSATSLGMLLKILGMEVQVAHDGPTALASIESYRPNFILLDIGMPGMDGYEVARRIRERREFDDIVLIALTGWGQAGDRQRSRAAGFQHHLVKPADIAALRSLLDGEDA
ncbi:MAG: PAS domain S-box protein [Pirellulales bacterium]